MIARILQALPESAILKGRSMNQSVFLGLNMFLDVLSESM